MSRPLSLSACARAGLVLGGAALAPSERSSTGPMPGMTYDAARGEVVVFGGVDVQTNVALNDTWTWNGQDWRSR